MNVSEMNTEDVGHYSSGIMELGRREQNEYIYIYIKVANQAAYFGEIVNNRSNNIWDKILGNVAFLFTKFIIRKKNLGNNR